MRINNFNQLIEFFNQPETTVQQIVKITSEGLHIFMKADTTKEILIQRLIDFWEKWKHTNEKPFFVT